MSFNLKKVIDAFEAKVIKTAMIRAKNNKAEAARILGIKRTTLLMKLKRIEDDDKQTSESVSGQRLF